MPDDPMSILTQMMAQAPMPKPTLLDRIRSGVQAPDSKIVSPKGRKSRLFLRGLVGGFKADAGGKGDGRGSGGAGRSGGAPGGRSPGQEAADMARADYWRARATKAGEPDPVTVDPYFDVKSDAWEALAEQRRASAARSARAPVGRSGGGGGRSGGGGGSKMTFAGERASLNSKYRAELTRVIAALSKYYDPESPEYDAAVARKKEEVSRGYMRRLSEINKRWGADIGDDSAPIAPRPAAAPAGQDDAAARFIKRNKR